MESVNGHYATFRQEKNIIHQWLVMSSNQTAIEYEKYWVTTHPSKNQKKLDRFFEVQNRNHTTPIYCAAYWPNKRLRADFMEYGGFCVKKSLL